MVVSPALTYVMVYVRPLLRATVAIFASELVTLRVLSEALSGATVKVTSTDVLVSPLTVGLSTVMEVTGTRTVMVSVAVMAGLERLATVMVAVPPSVSALAVMVYVLPVPLAMVTRSSLSAATVKRLLLAVSGWTVTVRSRLSPVLSVAVVLSSVMPVTGTAGLNEP